MNTKRKVSALNATQKKTNSLFKGVSITSFGLITCLLSSCGSDMAPDDGVHITRMLNGAAHYYGQNKYGGTSWADSFQKTDSQLQKQYSNNR